MKLYNKDIEEDKTKKDLKVLFNFMRERAKYISYTKIFFQPIR